MDNLIIQFLFEHYQSLSYWWHLACAPPSFGATCKRDLAPPAEAS